MSFRIGQKVVCIYGGWRRDPGELTLRFPRKGAIYHVRGFPPNDPNPGSTIWLLEIVNRRLPGYGNEVAFSVRCFRPLIDRSTDTGMAILRRILDDHKPPIREHADRVTSATGENRNG